MKATGIVRRIEECGTIGQKSKKPHKHYGFCWFFPLNALVSKLGFGVFYITKRFKCVLNATSHPHKYPPVQQHAEAIRVY